MEKEKITDSGTYIISHTETENLFWGRPFKYWRELEKHADSLDVNNLIQEIADLRGRISFYESRVREMYNLMSKET